MRFDVEIPNTNIDLMFIPEGVKIPNGAISTCFLEIDSRNIIPEDLLSIDENSIKNPFAGHNAIIVNGPSFLVNSDKFLITHISKYVKSINSLVPLFYKFTINSKIQENAIRIYDYYGVMLSSDEYMIEQSTTRNKNTYIDTTYVYMNKPDRVMFIEWADQFGISKQLLSLEPIFSEATWDDLRAGESVPMYKYTISNNMVDTAYNGMMYVMYEYKVGMIRPPIANISDPWYIGIRNTSFVVNEQDKTFSYSVPEYYLQNAYTASKFKRFSRNKCKKIIDGFVKLQAPPAISKLDKIIVTIEDYNTKKVLRVFTSDLSIISKNVSGTSLSYEKILDVSYDGVIQLPISLRKDEIAYADFTIEEEYFEFRLVDFSTSILTHGGYFTIYMTPNNIDGSSSIFVANIGQVDNRALTEKAGVQGAGFKNMDEYYEFCKVNNLYHLATISMSSIKQKDMLTVHDARRVGGDIGDKAAICLDSSDMVYRDIIDRNIVIPMHDSVIAVFDSKRLSDYGILSLNEQQYTIDDRSKKIVNQIYKTIQENLDASTAVTFEYRKDNQIPPSKIISVVNGNISSLIIMTATEYTGV